MLHIFVFMVQYFKTNVVYIKRILHSFDESMFSICLGHPLALLGSPWYPYLWFLVVKNTRQALHRKHMHKYQVGNALA